MGPPRENAAGEGLGGHLPDVISFRPLGRGARDLVARPPWATHSPTDAAFPPQERRERHSPPAAVLGPPPRPSGTAGSGGATPHRCGTRVRGDPLWTNRQSSMAPDGCRAVPPGARAEVPGGVVLRGARPPPLPQAPSRSSAHTTTRALAWTLCCARARVAPTPPMDAHPRAGRLGARRRGAAGGATDGGASDRRRRREHAAPTSNVRRRAGVVACAGPVGAARVHRHRVRG